MKQEENLYFIMQIIASIWKKPYYTERNQAMIDAGVNIFRVKCSHWGAQDVSDALILAREQINKSGKNVKLLADLPEAKLRLGAFPQNTHLVKQDDEFRFLYGSQSSDPLAYIPFQTENLGNYLEIGDKFYLQDGQVSLEITSVHSSNEFIAKACNAGNIVQCTGMTVPKIIDKLDHIVPFIDEMLEKLPQSKPDMIAFSFVKSRVMLEQLLSKLNKYITPGWNPMIIAKIESKEGVDNLDEILELASGVMVARGDLALSIPFEYLGIIQKQIVAKARAKGKYSIVATGMLTSMLSQTIPQRSDILDITNACLDGASAIMLCNETAHNEHPGCVVETARRIINAVENH